MEGQGSGIGVHVLEFSDQHTVPIDLQRGGAAVDIRHFAHGKGNRAREGVEVVCQREGQTAQVRPEAVGVYVGPGIHNVLVPRYGALGSGPGIPCLVPQDGHIHQPIGDGGSDIPVEGPHLLGIDPFEPLLQQVTGTVGIGLLQSLGLRTDLRLIFMAHQLLQIRIFVGIRSHIAQVRCVSERRLRPLLPQQSAGFLHRSGIGLVGLQPTHIFKSMQKVLVIFQQRQPIQQHRFGRSILPGVHGPFGLVKDAVFICGLGLPQPVGGPLVGYQALPIEGDGAGIVAARRAGVRLNEVGPRRFHLLDGLDHRRDIFLGHIGL